MAEQPDMNEKLPDGMQPFALVGYFDTPKDLYETCEELRDAGFKMDAHTPFPIHGLEKAMGVGASKLPWIVLACAILGGIGAFTLQWWVHSVEYPQNISGKPFFAYEAYIPVTFELTVLASAFGTFFGLWGLCKLPTYFHPVMQHPSFHRATDDKFFVAVEANESGTFDVDRARAILTKRGAHEVVEVSP